MQPQGLGGMGGMGNRNVRPPGKSGLVFDHILSWLQGELQKSLEIDAELHNLTGAMNDIHTTLGGLLVRHEYYLYYKFKLTFFCYLIAVESTTLPIGAPSCSTTSLKSRPARTSPTVGNITYGPPTLADIQTQLHDTQSSLASHVDKVRALEDVFAEHDTIKREVSLLRQLVEKSSG
jgi:hypothetical protein